MRQHPIDLTPASIRARSQAGARTGRFIGVAAAALALTIVVATHSRLHLAAAQRQLKVTEAEAKMVFAVDAEAAELRAALREARGYIDRYERASFPLPLSAVVATLINALPESVSLDQLDVDAGARTSVRSPRSRVVEPRAEAPVRLLRCEIAGFAATDEHIAELVSRLERTAPFQHVNLDFSRTRKVHGHDAREFRLSFRIDLNASYDVAFAQHADSAREYADAQ